MNHHREGLSVSEFRWVNKANFAFGEGVPLDEQRYTVSVPLVDRVRELACNLNVNHRTTTEPEKPAAHSTRYIGDRLAVLESAESIGWRQWRCTWVQPSNERDEDVADNPWVEWSVRELLREAKRLQARVKELEAAQPKPKPPRASKPAARRKGR